MVRNIRVRSIKRQQVDEDKLALAFLMLAKILHEQEVAERNADSASSDRQNSIGDQPEAV